MSEVGVLIQMNVFAFANLMQLRSESNFRKDTLQKGMMKKRACTLYPKGDEVYDEGNENVLFVKRPSENGHFRKPELVGLR